MSEHDMDDFEEELDLAVDCDTQSDSDLEELDLEAEYQQELLEEMQFPAILIKGMAFALEFEYLRNRPYSEESAVPLYCFVEGRLVQVGFLDLTLSSLLTLGKVANYELDLYKNKDEVVPIDIRDPVFLEKFIKL